jgi:hypothetical protein
MSNIPSIRIPINSSVPSYTPLPTFRLVDQPVTANWGDDFKDVAINIEPEESAFNPPSIILPPHINIPIVAQYHEEYIPFSPEDPNVPHPYLYDFENNINLEVAPVPLARQYAFVPDFNYSASPVTEFFNAPTSNM